VAKSEKKRIAGRRPKAFGNAAVKASGKAAVKASGKAAVKASGKAKKSNAGRLTEASIEPDATVLDRLFAVVETRRDTDPTVSHSARLLSRGPAKVAQKFGEEAVECLIEAVAGNRDALVAESADVLYHLLVLWVSSGVFPGEVWAELIRREGISGIAEKAARTKPAGVRRRQGTSKIP
jgi:phosphoribosyl-ATP pyrophosphohydrolase